MNAFRSGSRQTFSANVDGPSKYFSKSVAAVKNGLGGIQTAILDVSAQTEWLSAAVTQLRFSEKIPSECVCVLAEAQPAPDEGIAH